MLKTAIRVVPRRVASSRTIISRRTISTAPPAKKSRTWKGAAVRWGIAGAGVYYYNTSNVFAEEPEVAIQKLDESIHHIQESNQPTIDAIVEEKRQRQAQALAENQKRQLVAEASATAQEAGEDEEEGELEDLEEEAGQQGAFNPETGEINWDCPCLGGMAHGPCGEEFKAAFSCFVYSKEEPKGVECIDKFKGMQDCFREHPEMYASELEDDEDEVEEELRSRGNGGEAEEIPSEVASMPSKPGPEEPTPRVAEDKKPAEKKEVPVRISKAGDEGEELISIAAQDATK